MNIEQGSELLQNPKNMLKVSINYWHLPIVYCMLGDCLGVGNDYLKLVEEQLHLKKSVTFVTDYKESYSSQFES